MKQPEKKNHPGRRAAGALLLLLTLVLVLALALQPMEQANDRRGTRLSVTDAYRSGISGRLDLITLSDVAEQPAAPQSGEDALLLPEQETQPPAAILETTSQPASEPEPAVTEETSVPTEPEQTEPMPTEPETTEPETTVTEPTEPETTETEPTEPETTETEPTEPETTETEPTEPETTEPEAIETETTEPESTEPEQTEELLTEPEQAETVEVKSEPSESETTVPETTVPETTVPETTVPEATVPETTEPEPTEPPKKHYRIPETALAAPLPNPDCYGEADTPAEMAQVLERAAEVLEGQQLFFSTEVELLPDSKIYYYLDETIFSVVWKQKLDNAVFTFAETKVMDPTQFRRYLSGGQFGSGKLALTSEMSRSVNAVVGCSADFYAYRYEGVAVVDGVVEKCRNGVKDSCFVDYNGDLILVPDRLFSGKEELQEFVDENNIQFSLSFGPVIVKDGEFCCPREYRLGEVYGKFPRAAICQMDRLHYLYIASNKELVAPAMLPMMQFAQRVAETGCFQAYALDGGQTTTVVMNNEVRNHVNYGSERPISDIIYFATAKPTEEGNP